MGQYPVPMIQSKLNEYILRQSGGLGSPIVSYILHVVRSTDMSIQIDSAFSENMIKDYGHESPQVERMTAVQQRLYHLYTFYGESQTVHF